VGEGAARWWRGSVRRCKGGPTAVSCSVPSSHRGNGGATPNGAERKDVGPFSTGFGFGGRGSLQNIAPSWDVKWTHQILRKQESSKGAGARDTSPSIFPR
jgi:hypothetical protein